MIAIISVIFMKQDMLGIKAYRDCLMVPSPVSFYFHCKISIFGDSANYFDTCFKNKIKEKLSFIIIRFIVGCQSVSS